MGEALGSEVPRRILEMFLGDAVKRIADLHRSLACGDAVSFTHTAHSLKGSSANLGAAAFADLCDELERLGSMGELAGAEAPLSRLQVEYRAVEAALRQLLVELEAA